VRLLDEKCFHPAAVALAQARLSKDTGISSSPALVTDPFLGEPAANLVGQRDNLERFPSKWNRFDDKKARQDQYAGACSYRQSAYTLPEHAPNGG
jgi:hypothetical protein